MVKIKSEKGSIVLYVLVAMLFFVMFMMTIFIASSNKEVSQLKTTQEIKDTYGDDVNNIENIYQDLKTEEPVENNISEYKFGVPVPNGFYYVGGSKNTGVVISDNALDKNKGDSHNVIQTLKGNQFVWIPCLKEELKPIDWGVQHGIFEDYVDNTLSKEYIELEKSVEKYSGFYIGRYEASYGSGTTNETYMPLEKHSQTALITAWQNTPGRLGNWQNAITAKNASNNMYKENNSVVSFLPFTMQIDRVLKWFIDSGTLTEGDLKLNSKSFANLLDSSFTYSGGTKNSGQLALIKSGEVQQNKVNNIYDLGGNMWEWNNGVHTATNHIIVRSGSYGNDGTVWGSTSKHHLPEINTYVNVGFRVSLYIK